jgi:hypothetical protein
MFSLLGGTISVASQDKSNREGEIKRRAQILSTQQIAIFHYRGINVNAIGDTF